MKEGQVRIPSGCAISGIIDKKGNRFNGTDIIKSIALMHERSNGLGGGFAGYGIYPQYKDFFALHIFYDNNQIKAKTEEFLNEHFEIESAGNIPWLVQCVFTGFRQEWQVPVFHLRARFSPDLRLVGVEPRLYRYVEGLSAYFTERYAIAFPY